MSSAWVRVSKSRPCPSCGRSTWCAFSADGAVLICMRVGSPDTPMTTHGGFLHRLKERDPLAPPSPRPIATARVSPDWTAEVTAAQKATKPAELEAFAADLGVSAASLRSLGAFASRRWAGPMGVPMFDARGRAVGVRIRNHDGQKWAASGSCEGVFLPNTVPGAGPLLLPEGPTTSAACLDFGYETAGRPSARPGALAMGALLALCRSRDVVLVAENDAKPDGRHPGREGAEHCANLLRRVASRCRIIYPPSPHKDARDWLKAGATHADLAALIEAAPLFEPDPARQEAAQ